jgi:hypothetical protein
MIPDQTNRFVLVSLPNLLGIAPSFPTREVRTKPGMVHLRACVNDEDIGV